MMDIFNDKKHNKVNDPLIDGGFEKMIKTRKQKLPKLEVTIQDTFKDYTGELVVVIRMNEDENGVSDTHSLFIGGVSPIATQLKMIKALENASQTMMEQLIESVQDTAPEMLPNIMKELLGSAIDDMIKVTKKRG